MPEYTAPVDDLRFALKLSNHEDLTTWPPEQVVMVSAPVRSVAVIKMLLYELKMLIIARRVITRHLQRLQQKVLLLLLPSLR